VTNYEELIERLTVHFTSERFSADVLDAKREFFDEAGIMDEENVMFEMRMTQFLEWYLFTRLLQRADKKTGLTPVKFALESESGFKMTPEERPLFENLARIRHSLFEFQKIRGEDIYIKDIFTGDKITIIGSPIQVGFSREELFDARLIPEGDTFLFTRAFAFHPEQASKYILAETKKIKKADPALHEALMLRLLKMRYKFEQYKHLKLEHVYTNERKVRF
jgi:hypothetical protein